MATLHEFHLRGRHPERCAGTGTGTVGYTQPCNCEVCHGAGNVPIRATTEQELKAVYKELRALSRRALRLERKLAKQKERT